MGGPERPILVELRAPASSRRDPRTGNAVVVVSPPRTIAVWASRLDRSADGSVGDNADVEPWQVLSAEPIPADATFTLPDGRVLKAIVSSTPRVRKRAGRVEARYHATSCTLATGWRA